MKNEAVVKEQPKPVPGELIVQEEILHFISYGTMREHILKDIMMRGEMGREKYGSYLMTKNGRDADLDLYQELCDAIVYAAQGMLESGPEHEQVIDEYLGGRYNYDRSERWNWVDKLFSIALSVRFRLIEKGVLEW